MDLDAVRRASHHVLEGGRFTANTGIDVPQHGVRSASTYTVDLDRALARVSTTITMTPVAGASTSWTPQDGDPVVHWVVGDHMLMQLPDEDGSRPWISLPHSPLLSSELSLLLWPAAVIEASTARRDTGAISAVVDLAKVIEHAPTIHTDGAAQFIAHMALGAGDQVAVELTLADGALSQISLDHVIDAEEGPTQHMVHLTVDPDASAPLGDPPHSHQELDADELMRAFEASTPGGPQWWTRTRPLRP